MFFFFQAEDGIRDLVRSRGLGDVYKRQGLQFLAEMVRTGRPASELTRCFATVPQMLKNVRFLSLIHI